MQVKRVSRGKCAISVIFSDTNKTNLFRDKQKISMTCLAKNVYHNKFYRSKVCLLIFQYYECVVNKKRNSNGNVIF